MEDGKGTMEDVGKKAIKTGKSLFLLIFLMFCFVRSFSQQGKPLAQIGLNGLTGSDKSIYKNGYGLNAEYLWVLSPSFNLGPEVSGYNISSKLGGSDLQTLSVRLEVAWFPKRLIESITKKESMFLNGFYFNEAIGYNFIGNEVFNNDGLNSWHVGVGYIFPGKTSAYFNLGANSFVLRSNFTDEQKLYNDLFTLTVGIHFKK